MTWWVFTNLVVWFQTLILKIGGIKLNWNSRTFDISFFMFYLSDRTVFISSNNSQAQNVDSNNRVALLTQLFSARNLPIWIVLSSFLLFPNRPIFTTDWTALQSERQQTVAIEEENSRISYLLCLADSARPSVVCIGAELISLSICKHHTRGNTFGSSILAWQFLYFLSDC